MITDLPSIAEIIARYGLAPKKALGQNFILDLNITRKIARQGLPFSPTETILEIGPGPGALTRALLLEGAPFLVALEKDTRCVEALDELCKKSEGRLKILNVDALKSPLKYLGSGPFKIIANLPYNISTALLLRWLEEIEILKGLVLMFQKEVAERLIASPRTKAYGRLSVLVQLRFEASIAFDLPPDVFKPCPKVTSSIVILKPRQEYPSGKEWEVLKQLITQGFAHRRKLLRSALSKFFKDPAAILDSLNLSPTCRAEELTPCDFKRLAACYLEQ